MRPRLAITLGLCAAALAACGGEEAERDVPSAADGTRLVVEVRPRGPRGPVRRRVVRSLPERIAVRDFAPVPPDVACAEIYGGPQTARVTGTIDGRAVRASFRRTNGCEIARWDRLAPLLGRVRGAPSLP